MLFNSPYGYYKVGNQVYLTKSEAVYQATKTKEHLHWNFHDEIYSSMDWSKRPAGSLKDLYRERAQQLRDQYDHIVIYFSGGMDSWTVLDSFLSNGIHVDEIYTAWPRAERKFIDPDPFNRDEINFASEFEYAVLPVLEHVSKHFPNTKISINDYSESLTEFTDHQLMLSNNYQSMTTYHKFNSRSDEIIRVTDQNKSVGCVYGFDKLKYKNIDGKFYAFFLDSCGGASGELAQSVEFFYHSPNFPQLAVLQAHCLKDYIKENAATVLDPANKVQHGERGEYIKSYQRVCYPDYNPDTFQTGKQLGTLVRKSEFFIQKYSPRYYESWKSITNDLFENVSDEYLARLNNNFTVGLKYCSSTLYLVEESTGLPNFDWLKWTVNE
jgi:hypothetical protein